MSTETQTIEVTGAALSNVLRGQSSLAGAAPAQSTPSPDVEIQVPPTTVTVNEPPPVAEAPPAGPQGPSGGPGTPGTPPPADVAPAVDAPAPAADPYAAAVSELLDGPAAEVEWTPEAKDLFKKSFGVEDPKEFKTTYEQKLAEADLYKKKYEEVAPIQDRLTNLPPAMHRALQLALDGDTKAAQEYIKSLPTIALENKEAKDLPVRSLIDTYLPGKVKPEQWDLLNDPEADEDVVDAIKQRVGILGETASEMHEKTRNEAINQWQQAETAKKQAFEQFQQGVAASIANAKASTVRVFVDENIVKKVQDGSFIFDYVKEDGVTPTPHALTQHLKALHYDNAVKAAEARGYERGTQEAILKATSRQPSMPRVNGRDPGAPALEMTQDQQVDSIIQKAVAR